jgi:hypothetical protein
MAEARDFFAGSDDSTTETMRGNIMYYFCLPLWHTFPPECNALTRHHAFLSVPTDKDGLLIKDIPSTRGCTAGKSARINIAKKVKFQVICDKYNVATILDMLK